MRLASTLGPGQPRISTFGSARIPRTAGGSHKRCGASALQRSFAVVSKRPTRTTSFGLVELRTAWTSFSVCPALPSRELCRERHARTPSASLCPSFRSTISLQTSVRWAGSKISEMCVLSNERESGNGSLVYSTGAQRSPGTTCAPAASRGGSRAQLDHV